MKPPSEAHSVGPAAYVSAGQGGVVYLAVAQAERGSALRTIHNERKAGLRGKEHSSFRTPSNYIAVHPRSPPF